MRAWLCRNSNFIEIKLTFNYSNLATSRPSIILRSEMVQTHRIAGASRLCVLSQNVTDERLNYAVLMQALRRLIAVIYLATLIFFPINLFGESVRNQQIARWQNDVLGFSHVMVFCVRIVSPPKLMRPTFVPLENLHRTKISARIIAARFGSHRSLTSSSTVWLHFLDETVYTVKQLLHKIPEILYASFGTK